MKKKIWIIFLIVSFMWVMHTFSKNFIIDPDLQNFISKKDSALTNELLWIRMIRLHIIFAMISLITGPFGVIKKLRIKSINFHRWNGRVYVLSILLNFIPGVYVAFFATGGWLSTMGFLVLNLLWFGTTILGYINIRRKKVERHSVWMTRSFFLSFANLIIYVIVAVSHNALHMLYDISYTIAVWLCWMICLGAAEIIIRKRYLYH